MMSELDSKTLYQLTQQYVWWKPPEEGVLCPERVIAQVMNIGDYDDVQKITNILGDDYLREIVRTAEVGQFSPQSWAYWHYRLGITETGKKPPPMPQRKCG